MPRFQVCGQYVVRFDLEVEAKDEDEVEEKVSYMALDGLPESCIVDDVIEIDDVVELSPLPDPNQEKLPGVQ